MLDSYDSSVAPEPDEWLALPEADRVGIVQIFHEDAGESGGSRELHAMIHVVVEPVGTR